MRITFKRLLFIPYLQMKVHSGLKTIACLYKSRKFCRKNLQGIVLFIQVVLPSTQQLRSSLIIWVVFELFFCLQNYYCSVSRL